MEMRRKDREMPETFAFYVIDKSEYGILAFCDGGEPYTVPLSMVRAGRTLYYHSAKRGRKVSLAKDNPQVSVSFVGSVHVPNVLSKEEMDAILADPSKHSQFGKKVFTTGFESVQATGTLREVTDREEMIEALRRLCEKYTPSKMDYFEAAATGSLHITAIFAVDMDHISAKRKGLDAQGNSLKDGIGWPENYPDYKPE